MDIRFIIMPYCGERGSNDRSDAPASIVDEALLGKLRDSGEKASSEIIALTADEDHQYGEWQRVALANRHLGESVAAALAADDLPIGLLANCNALPGMLAGLQHTVGRGRDAASEESGARGPVGMIWIDAHADFNTPETTLSGMLGGMPVALAAGLCLHRLRETTGMTEPIDPKHIIMAGLRDVDPLEQELLDRYGVRTLPLPLGEGRGEGSHPLPLAPPQGRGEGVLRADTGPGSAEARGHESVARMVEHKPLLVAARKLAGKCEAIYVHVDMDVLDPAEVPGHPLTVDGGPTSEQLAAVLVNLFTMPQVRALGIASMPPPDLDPFASARRAAHRLMVAAIQSAQTRSQSAQAVS